MPGQDRTNQYLRRSVSVSGDGFLMTTYADDNIAAGYAFTVNEVLTIPGNSTRAFYLEPDSTKFYFIPPVFLQSSANPVYFTVYESPTVSADGTPVTPLNRNRFSENLFTGSLFVAPTVTDNGTQLIQHAAFASGTPNSLSSGASGASTPLILDSNKNYLVVVSNEDSGDTLVEYDAILYELPSAEGVSD